MKSASVDIVYVVVFDMNDKILKLPHPYPYPPERSPYRLRNSDSAINHVASPPLDKSNQKYIDGLWRVLNY